MKREFYYQDDRSNKFWTIELDGNSYVTKNGRFGATPRETKKTFENEAEAKKQYEKQIVAKLKKGYVEGQSPEYQKPDWTSMSMSEAVFWRLISLFDWKKLGDDDAVIKPAVSALSQMKVEDIHEFENILAKKLYALDTKEHAMGFSKEPFADDAYFSPDMFLYTRCVPVANGDAYYREILGDPTKMRKDMDFEPLLTVASQAYERKTDDEFDPLTDVSYETFSNEAGWLNTRL